MANYGFWEERWLRDSQPWHGPSSDEMLREMLPALMKSYLSSLDRSAFIPLCGNSSAVSLLYEAGFQVTAVDFVPTAILRLIDEHFPSIPFAVNEFLSPTSYKANRLRLHVADIFSFSTKSPFSFIYDRAALIALDQANRIRYAKKLVDCLAPGGLLFSVAIENSLDDPDCGPPFSVPRDSSLKLFDSLDLLEQKTVANIEPAQIHRERGVEVSNEYVTIFRRM